MTNKTKAFLVFLILLVLSVGSAVASKKYKTVSFEYKNA